MIHNIYIAKTDSKLRPPLRVLLYFLFLLLLTPEILRTNSAGKLAFIAVRGFAGVIAMVLFFMDKKKSRPLRYLSIYILYIGIVTALNGFEKVNLIRYIAIYADIFIVSVYTEYLIKKDTCVFLKFLNIVVWIGLLFNTFSVFAFPKGMVQVANEVGVTAGYYFYDYDNHFIVRYIPSILVIFAHERCFHRKAKGGRRTILAISICFLTLVRVKSMASVAAMLIVIIGCILIYKIPPKLFNIRGIWTGYLVVSGILVTGSSIIGTSIVNELGKATSLWKRTTIWGLAMDAIAKKPIFGTGILSAPEMRDRFWYAQLHNTMMTTILWGGIIGLVLYTVFIFSLQNDFQRLKMEKGTEFRFFSVLFAAIAFASLFDGLELLANLYLFYIIIGNYKYIENLDKLLNTKKIVCCQSLRLIGTG